MSNTPSEPHTTAPTWAVGDRVTVFDVIGEACDDLLGFIGVECEVVSLPDPEDPYNMVRVRHVNGLMDHFFPEELAPVGTPTTKRAKTAIAESSRPGRYSESLAYVCDRVQAWQAKTFGDRSPMAAQIDKLRDEVAELAEAWGNLTVGDLGAQAGPAFTALEHEIADVQIVLLGVLGKINYDHRHLAKITLRKLAKNEPRTWAPDTTGKFSGSKPADPDDDGTIPWACDVCGEMGTKANGPEGYCADHWPKRHTPCSTHSTKD